jgi:membrane-bound lytic murein transglycosylase F
MLKLLYTLCLLLLCALPYACSSDNSKDEANQKEKLPLNEIDLPGILKRGKLVVLAENSATSYFIYKGKKLGQ